MAYNQDPNQDPNPDNRENHANDNEGAVAPAPSGGTLASLTGLATVLNNIDIASVAGRSGLPMLTFKREGSGTWAIGQKRTIVEEGSRWAVNPKSFKYGFICFDNNNKVAAERLVPVSQPKPDVTTLPDKGFPWTEQWGVNVKCLTGADRSTEAVFKPTTVGGIQAISLLIEAVRDRLNDNQHDGKVSPIVHLEKDSYQHPQFGKVWTPVLTIVDWMSLDGPEPAPAPAPAPTSSPSSATEQPRRRHVG